ncbi:uncharacterized protein SPAPADRAFT_157959 [Spathaspora passalidarum NRRL Y-27907]|uniref:Sfi1 spindle body domain-containing protein n=1 Tax=Spathaspora passalidarum (strain NRRL Y-27907 / 11-Y1) TaxID=619300 RepID=G3AUZ9_SPAPN|nr:uncharacterized protein SPAPADRAFT_157959 [Spathaspora passalidarum NRRL Y-27907]EGW29856.1 hypothetical protein SPAPADRAFT_157959 [Spathaspora passalidarum NRRL Y-27907]
MTLKTLLHTTIRDLHALHVYRNWDDAATYESKLTSTVSQLLQLLNFTKGQTQLKLDSSVGAFRVWCYGSAPDYHDNIIDYLQKLKSGQSTVGILRQLIELLTEKTPTNIKDEYSTIFLKLSRIVEKLIKHHTISQIHLIKYVSGCFQYENKYYSQLHNKFTTIDDDTVQIAEFMDSFLSDVEFPEEDSIFNYESDSQDTPLNLQSNQDAFVKLFRKVVNVINIKTDVNHDKLASIFVQLYKNQQGIDYFEDSQDSMTGCLTELLTGLGEEHQEILPKSFAEINKKVILKATSNSQQQQAQLFADLKVMISLFNDLQLDFEPEFPWLVRHYMKLMFTKLPTIVNPQDWEYLASIMALAQEILAHDANPVMDQVHKFKQLHLLLCKENFLLDDSTLLMRASTQDYYRMKEMVEVTWQGWREKWWKCFQLQSVLADCEVNHENKLRQHFTKLWFGRFKKLDRIKNEVGVFYQYELARKYLIQWRKAVAQHIQSMHVADRLPLKKFLHTWKTTYTVKTQLEQKCREVTLNKYFTLIKKVYSANQANLQLAIDKNRQFENDRNDRIYSYYFLKWYLKMDSSDSPESLSEKLVQLKKLERKFILCVYFNKLMHAYDLAVKVHQFRRNKDGYLIQKIFNFWGRSWTLRDKSNGIIYSRNMDLQAKVLQHWSKSLSQQHQADQFYKSKLKTKFIALLKQRIFNTQQEEKFNAVITKRYFKLWLTNYKLSQVMIHKDQQVKLAALQLWMERTNSVLTSEIDTSNYYNESLIRSTFHNWQNYVNAVSAYDEKAITFVKQRYFNKLKKKYKQCTIELPARYQTNRLADVIALKYTLTIWHQRYNEQFELRAQGKIKQLHKQVTRPLLLKRYLSKWVMKYDKLNELEELAHEFTSWMQLAKPQLDLWIYKTQHQSAMNEEAEAFEAEYKIRRFFTIWQDHHSRAQELLETYEDYIANKNFTLVSECIKAWNLKYHKNIKRHQAQHQFLVAKFEHAKKRSIFDLWRYKYEHNQDFELANSTIISTSSPLAKRTQRQRQSQTQVSTPVKQVGNISPARLQETTQRLKTEKIGALIKHYGQVKLPQNYVRLSPPRTRGTVPARPNFNQILTDEDEYEEYASPSPSAIESAKSLNKIVPIRFPTDDEVNRPIFSPISTIKQRYRNT